MATTVNSFCRICTAMCATQVSVGDDGRVEAIRGDAQDPLHRGYVCLKGTSYHRSMNSDERLVHPLKRTADGTFVQIGLSQALDEIAERIAAIVAETGGDTMAFFQGNGFWQNSFTHGVAKSFQAQLGSTALFTSSTIDANAQLLMSERLGGWMGGRQSLDESDVGLMVGSNPLTSTQVGNLLEVDPVKRLKDAQKRGFKLIVIDPRRSETARNADLFVQPLPGQDGVVIASLVRIVLTEGWHDQDFCDRYVGPDRMAALASAVAPFTPEYAAERAGITAAEIYAVAEMFARDGRRGSAFNHSGVNMGPQADAGAHLLETLNIICGRFPRAGEPSYRFNPLRPAYSSYAEVRPPQRFRGQQHIRVRNQPGIFGERMTPALADEILTPGDGQLRGLLVQGGNPVNSVPDQERTVAAMRALDLLVVIDPFMTATARLAHYVLPAKMFYERGDVTPFKGDFHFAPKAWTYYTRAIAPAPGPEVVEEWLLLWELGKRLGLSLEYLGEPLDMTVPPTEDQLLARVAAQASVSLEELTTADRPFIAEGGQPRYVQPGRPEAAEHRFDVMPDDVAAEVAALLTQPAPPVTAPNGFLLTCRRSPKVYNTEGSSRAVLREKEPTNPTFMHADDMTALELSDGDRITVSSDVGTVQAVVKVDATMRRGAVSMFFGWGGLLDDEDDLTNGTSVNRLISSRESVQRASMMPRMTAIPVRIEPA